MICNYKCKKIKEHGTMSVFNIRLYLVRAMSKDVSEEVTVKLRTEGRIVIEWGRMRRTFQVEGTFCV